jgi:hypothetical protein
MITTCRGLCLTLLILLSSHAYEQELRTFNQNSSRTNHTHALSLSLSPYYSNALNNRRDSLLFRGSGAGFKVGADYFLGKAGIGFATGFGSSSPDNSSINNFLKNAPIPPDQLLITKANQQNMFLLVGPTIRFGNAVQLYAHAKGGLFVNSGGLVSIQQKGAQRAAYRNESTGRTLYPGFQTGISFNYSGRSDAWSFGIGADYMNTKTEVNNYDVRRGGGIEGLKLTQNIHDFVAGISVRYNLFAGRDNSALQSNGKRVLPTVNKRELVSQDNESARVLPTVNKRESNLRESGLVSPENSCGPVTSRITHTDGTTEDLTFSCPADAANYASRMGIDGGMPNRISMNVTVPKQTQGATFGEKTFAAPHVLEAKGIIAGTLTWSSSQNSGIVTNLTVSPTRSGSATMNSQSSSTRQTDNSSFGTWVSFSARETGSGMASGKRSREAGSGIATGRRQYQAFFAEGKGDVCNPCMITAKLSTVKNNPLYSDNGLAGTNALYNKRTTGGDDDCDGIAGADIYLLQAGTNEVVAKTKTSPCGDFIFANLPGGNYAIRVASTLSQSKEYSMSLPSSIDLLGEVAQSNDWMQLTITSSMEENANTQKAGVSTSRSNIRTKSISIIEADLDGDGEFESMQATGTWDDGTSMDMSRSAGTVINTPGSGSIVLNENALSMRRRVEVLKSNREADPGRKTITSLRINNGQAQAVFSDGSMQDVTGGLKTNASNNNIRQYSITLADLDGDGAPEAVVKTKTKSNQSNDRVASGDVDGDGIWSPRSNIKLIRVAAGDVDGDGQVDMNAGNLRTSFAILLGGKKGYFETGDKPTQDQLTRSGSTEDPGAAAMRPGSPIPGVIVKGGKNPGGNLRTIQTDPHGQFELKNLEAGDYIFTIDQKLIVDDLTYVSVGNDPANNIVTSESNLKDVAARNGNDPNGTTGNNQTRAQNNNTVRSNRTDNALIDLGDLNDSNDNPGNDPVTTKKEKSNVGPVKWMAPESMKTAITNSNSQINNLLLTLDQLEQLVNTDQNSSRSIVNTSRSNIKNQRAALQDLRQTLETLQQKERDDAMSELDQRVGVLNQQFLALQESLSRLGRQYTTISNVLKTRHESAMNAIRNMK